MPNINIIQRLVGANTPAVGANAIPSIVPTVTSAFIVTNQQGNAAALTVGSGAYASGASTAPSFATNFDGLPFRLRINGKITTGASMNLTVAFMVGNTTTYTSGNVVATTGALAANSTSANFQLECVCLWDSVGQKVQGAILPSSWVNATAVSTAVLTNSNAVAVTTQAGLVFVPVLTCSATTGVTITISEFVAEAA
jgi:hypothetical protein